MKVVGLMKTITEMMVIAMKNAPKSLENCIIKESFKSFYLLIN